MALPIPLLSGAYNSPAYIAGAQRCVNLFPEANPADLQPQGGATPSIPFTHRLTPGLIREFIFPDATVVRMLWRASNGDLYGVCGASIYYIAPNYTLYKLGTIIPGTTPVKMSDNGVDAVVVDGTDTGYQINLATRVMTGITSANASGLDGFGWAGGSSVDEVDGFIIANQPGTANWVSSSDYQIQFDSLSTAAKSGSPDPIQFLAVIRRYVWLVGQLSSEIWYDAGGVQFPFALNSGPYIEHGANAKYSYAKVNESLLWLSQDRNGKCVFVEGSGLNYAVARISNHAIEQEIQKYNRTDDAVGMSYQWGGHSFYVCAFPTANYNGVMGKTWVYDLTTKQWHEWVSFDSDMNEQRWRGNCIVNAYDKLLVGDRENGKVYLLDFDTFTDDGSPIQRRRGFPHILNQLKRIRHQQFLLDIETGNLLVEFQQPLLLLQDPCPPVAKIYTDGPDPQPLLLDPVTSAYNFGEPQIYLRWSTTRGKSWGNPVARSLGSAGQYSTSVQWRRLGLARDMVYEIFWTSPQVTALNGTFVELDSGRT